MKFLPAPASLFHPKVPISTKWMNAVLEFRGKWLIFFILFCTFLIFG